MAATPVNMLKRLCFACLSATALAGCAPGDIALEGKIFDAVGLSGTQQGGGRVVKLADRAPLVVPPSLTSLPAPGETGSTTADAIAGIDDPDRKKNVDKATLEKQHAEFCRVNYELAKARGDQTAEGVVGPLGACRPSIFTAIQKWNVAE